MAPAARAPATSVRSSPILLAAVVSVGLWAPAPAWANDGYLTPPPPSDEGGTAAFVNVQAGASTIELAGILGLTFESDSLLVGARAGFHGELALGVSPAESVAEYGLLGGKSWRRDALAFYVAAGLGRATTTRRGRFLGRDDGMWSTEHYEELRARVWSVPFEIGVALDGRTAGIGLAMVGNLNSELPALGVVLGLRLGKLR